MSSALVLERFDLDQASTSDDLLNSAQDLSDRTTDLTPPFVAPATQDPDKATEDSVRDELAEAVSHLVAAISDVKLQANAACDQVSIQMTQAIAEASQTLLPSLIDPHIGEEIASAALQIAVAKQQGEFGVRLSPDDHDLVVDHLQMLAPPSPLSITSDSSLARGTAVLSWDWGGAIIDQAALISEARAVLNAHRASQQPEVPSHDG